MNPTPTLERLRFNMIEQQIRPWDVLDLEILDLLASIRREDYVPPEHRALAFFDMEIPLGNGSAPGQVMLSPKVEARMLQDLHVQKPDPVPISSTDSCFCTCRSCSMRASTLGESITWPGTEPSPSGISMSKKDSARCSGGT